MQKKSKKIRLFLKYFLINKKEGLRTPQISSLNALIHDLNIDDSTYGASYGIRTHDPLDHNQML